MSIWQQLQSFQEFMSDFQATIKDPASKEQYGDLLGKLKKASAEAQQVVPGVVQGLKAGAEKTKAEAEALQKEFERLQQGLEQAKAQADKPAATMVQGLAPEPAIPANLGKQYTAELLQAFGPTPTPATPAEQAGSSLWRHVDDMHKADPGPTPTVGTPLPKDGPKPPPADRAEDGSMWRVLDDPDKPAKLGG